MYLVEFESLTMNDNWKNKSVFVEINSASDMEIIFVNCLKKRHKRLITVVPE